MKDALIQEGRRLRIRAENARDGLRNDVERLETVNERRQEALLKVETYHREKYNASKAEATIYKSDAITDGSVEACLSDALLHLEASEYVGGLIAADRAALERKEEAMADLHIEPIDAVEVAALHVTCGICGRQNLVEYDALDQEESCVDPAHDFQRCEECGHVYDASQSRLSANLQLIRGGDL